MCKRAGMKEEKTNQLEKTEIFIERVKEKTNFLRIEKEKKNPMTTETIRNTI